ncbi:hypothetical protein FHR83_007884 [Actinoplanes campanulatus]|uniref:Transmembrane protein n=1 Tax=Actinoplanes campanulatus TaxID=113559 RepID=A0A7W5FIY8_9ACTN|nr:MULTISPECIES: hypothetical protein [Actinoplanes]MBB3100164.1 hypothetical protein [Actinoplanes campanulatus]GGN28591.1 hypothetical protein GCM10010109_46990 [Actinoplanes campanulatus]GID39025.1 hypothetical protein Aca09nite_55310 [Actinoplanes campanulatus]GID44538.1 hypothetical protein Aca07nite_18130 [Actinoplanes capillaceus]
MKPYADRFPVALRQLVTDVLVVLWVYLWIRVALWINDVVERLAVPGQKLESAGSGIADNLADAGGKVGRVPVVGDDLTRPFTGAADAARAIADAGHEQQEIVGRLALILPLVAVAVPLALVLFLWLPLRLRWMRRAGIAAAVRDDAAGRDLLALRALAGRPLSELTRLGPDIAQSWRAGDAAAVEALAELELRALGLRVRRR